MNGALFRFVVLIGIGLLHFFQPSPITFLQRMPVRPQGYAGSGGSLAQPLFG